MRTRERAGLAWKPRRHREKGGRGRRHGCGCERELGFGPSIYLAAEWLGRRQEHRSSGIRGVKIILLPWTPCAPVLATRSILFKLAASIDQVCQAGRRIASSHIEMPNDRRGEIVFAGPNGKRHAGTAMRPVLFRRRRARRVPPRAPVGVAAWRRWLAARKRVPCGGPGTRGTRPSRVCP